MGDADLRLDPAERALPPRQAIDALLARRGVTVVGFSDWRRLDDVAVARGARRGAPRDKISDIASMLDLLTPPLVSS